MKFSNPAGGFAAAAFLLMLGVFNPTPSRAWEMNSVNAATPTPVPVASDPALPAVATIPPAATPVAPPADAAAATTDAAAGPKTIAAPAAAVAETVEAYAAGAASDGEQDCLAT